MAKSKTVAQLRKKLWKLMSEYIRSTSAIEGSEKFGKCFTCNKVIDLKYECDVGHFYPKGAFGCLRFDERNLRIQCKTCNLFLQGNVVEFEKRLRAEIGDEHMEELHATRRDVFKPGKAWYVSEVERYTQLTKELEWTI